MSVVFRQLDGRDYLHVHRKMDKKEHNRFINVTGLFGKELALKKYEANQLDNALREQQISNNDSIMSWFVDRYGKPKHIIIAPPCKKSGWSVKCVIIRNRKAVFTKSLSIEKHTAPVAIETMVKAMTKHFGISPKSPIYSVLQAIYQTHFKNKRYTS